MKLAGDVSPLPTIGGASNGMPNPKPIPMTPNGFDVSSPVSAHPTPMPMGFNDGAPPGASHYRASSRGATSRGAY